MPIIKSAIKRARQQTTRRQRNIKVKTAVKRDIKAVIGAIEAKDTKQAQEALRAAVSEIDRAVKKGVLHKNTAARKKSRLMKSLNAAVGSQSTAKPKAAARAAVKKTPAKKAAVKPAAKKSPTRSAKKSAAQK